MAGIRFSAVLLSPEMSLPTLAPALEKRDSSPDILVKRCNVKGSFYKELADRIISLPANQEELRDYGRYVSIIRRHWLKISREELATIAELETEYLLFLENNLMSRKLYFEGGNDADESQSRVAKEKPSNRFPEAFWR